MIQAKYLALGDSYTIGESLQESERFPAQVAELLKAENIAVTTFQYIAATGWTTADLLSAIEFQNPAKDFDFVTLLIGVNDQYQHLEPTDYRERFLQLLAKAVDFASGRKQQVFVLSIPDYSVTPFVSVSDKERVSREINEFNAINREVTLQNQMNYLDITSSCRMAQNDPTLIAGDGLHPSGKEYSAWAKMLAPLIKLSLK